MVHFKTNKIPCWKNKKIGFLIIFFLLRWRENIWKEWLFYELGPGVNYHKRYDYRPNYNISFGIDMFFGHI